MLLSLDGLMKVEFESELDLTVGDTVTVEYSGSSEEGKIASVRQGKVTVTLSDETAPYGAKVTVLDEAGKQIGEGTLDINAAMKVINYYGTVSQLYVNLNDMVSDGSMLMYLTDTGYTTDYQILLARRNELEEQMQQFSQLSKTGMVYAENDGVVSGVPDNAEIELLSGVQTATVNTLANTSNGWRLVLLSDITTTTDSPPEPTPTPEPTPEPESTPTPTPEPTLEPSPSPEPTPAPSTSPDVTPTPSTSPDGATPTPTPEPSPDGATTPTPEPSPTISPEPTPTPSATLNGNYAAALVSTDTASSKIYVWLAPAAVAGDVDLETLKAQMSQFGEYAYASLCGRR